MSLNDAAKQQFIQLHPTTSYVGNSWTRPACVSIRAASHYSDMLITSKQISQGLYGTAYEP